MLPLIMLVLAYLGGCKNMPQSGETTAYSIDNMGVDATVANRDTLFRYRDYSGKIIKVSPRNGVNWEEWSRPVFRDLSEYSGLYNITITVSLLAETSVTRSWSDDPRSEPGFTLNPATVPMLAYDPSIGWTIQNGSVYNRFGGQAVEIPKNEWVELKFFQTVDLSAEGNRRVFIDGHNEQQGLVDLTLYIRNFTVTLEKVNRYIALTFDDGPSETTGKLLDKLAQLNVKATFFLLGASIDAINPKFDSNLNVVEHAIRVMERRAFVRRMFDEGHDIGSHSYSHNYMGGGKLNGLDGIDSHQLMTDVPLIAGYSVASYPLGEAEIRRELEDSLIAIQQAVYGDTDYMNHPWVAKYFRTPFNTAQTPILARETEALGLPILYGQESYDYDAQVSANEIAARIFETSRFWGISINHDPGRAPHILEALDKVVPMLRAAGFEFVTISEMAEKRGTPLIPGVIYQTLEP